MPRIFPLFKKITVVAAAGGAQFAGLQTVGVHLSNLLSGVASVSPGAALTSRLDALGSPVKPGVAISTAIDGSVQYAIASGIRLTELLTAITGVSPAAALAVRLDAVGAPVKPALAVTSSGAGTTEANVVPAPAVVGSVLNTNGAADSAPAAEIVQITYDLVGTYGAATATNTTVTGSAWTSSGNAAGEPNGVLSTHPGNALSAQDAHLTFAFPTLSGKTDLAITKVEILFWASQTGTVANNGELRLLYGPSANPSEILLDNFPDNQNFITGGSAPKVRDITSDTRFTTWAGLADLRARVRHTAAVAETHVGNVDAVQLRVTATRTDSL